MVARAKEEGPGTDDKQEGETSTKVHLRFPLREEAVKLKKRTRWTETQEGQASPLFTPRLVSKGGSRLPVPWAFSAWPHPSGEGSAVFLRPAFESCMF